MVILAGTGLLLVAVGGGTVDRMGVTQTENAGGKGGAELMVDSSGLKSTLRTDTSLRLNLLFYGLGVALWSIVVLSTLGDTLV
ncbi:hypothetical protein ACFQJC_15505 [Haloferax namakaokahaiae]|uniref:DUF8070 domain-containing protein n=1 Tax=Haloferax namakaokahaiae TaxID=1748331 RepID=A0ABD5ZJ30_9EURY